jgi:hypothetical protein
MNTSNFLRRFSSLTKSSMVTIDQPFICSAIKDVPPNPKFLPRGGHAQIQWRHKNEKSDSILLSEIYKIHCFNLIIEFNMCLLMNLFLALCEKGSKLGHKTVFQTPIWNSSLVEVGYFIWLATISNIVFSCILTSDKSSLVEEIYLVT